jgi:hypothetical protein
MAKRLTILNIPGDPDQIFELKHSVIDPVMSRKGPEYGGIAHIAARNPDGSGVIIVNLWESEEGSEQAFQDPEVQAMRAQISERMGGGEPPVGNHYEVVDLQGALAPATA